MPHMKLHFGQHEEAQDARLAVLSRYTIVSFDMDGTLIPGTTATLLFAELLGVRGDVEELEKQFELGRLDSDRFMNKISGKMRGLSRQFIRDHFYRVPIIGGLAETIAQLRAHGLVTVVVTTSNKEFAEVLKEQYGFDHVYGTEFEVMDDGVGSMGRGKQVCSSVHKVHHLNALAAKYNVSMDKVVAVGDSLSDVPLFSQVGLPIAFNYQEVLKGKAKVYLRSSTILDILPHILVNAGQTC